MSEPIHRGRAMTTLGKCIWCLEPFKKRNGVHLYCGVPCRDGAHYKRKCDSANRKIQPRACDFCFQMFVPNKRTRNRQLFCSRECGFRVRDRWESYRKKLTMQERFCQGCGKDIPPINYQRYCSMECKLEAKRYRSTETRIAKYGGRAQLAMRQCKICSVPLPISKPIDALYCSPRCYSKSLAPLERERSRRKSAILRAVKELGLLKEI